MIKMMSPRAMYHTMGKKNFLEYILFGVFVLFFYLPLLNLCMLAFANRYEVPAVIPQEFGFKWWQFVFEQDSLVSSIVLSFVLAVIVTFISMLICIPAAYALGRFNFKGKKIFLLSFLLSNAFPKMGLYISIGVIFYRLNLMGTLPGVVLIHVLNSLMFMTWIPANAFRSIHSQQEESARDAGAGPVRTFFSITLPMAMPESSWRRCSPSSAHWKSPRERCWWASRRSRPCPWSFTASSCSIPSRQVRYCPCF